jgi:periplasmic divalent cation tolerance protein
MILIFTTLGNKKSAVKIGKELLRKRIIACYNLFPVEAAYRWKGKIVEVDEVLMILKTKKENFDKVETI